MRVRIPAALTISAILLSAASCADDSDASGDPTITPPPTSTPSATATTAPQDETPEQFIRRWIAEDTRMQNTGETDAYLAMTWQCEDCTEFASLVARIYRKGGWIRTDGWTVTSVRADKGSSTKQRSAFIVLLDAAPTVYTSSEHSTRERYDGGPSKHYLELVKREGSWRVAVMNEMPL